MQQGAFLPNTHLLSSSDTCNRQVSAPGRSRDVRAVNLVWESVPLGCPKASAGSPVSSTECSPLVGVWKVHIIPLHGPQSWDDGVIILAVQIRKLRE